ncbi:hypothetical protein HMPREF0379_2069 [[Eubacterium] yurii subsp. margaretiae ATCC 43715]|nr:hypothetical protein HMPREF0379_2069 [[Eubacterium] yurii subsp. margaretiae ATCC 43715]
MRKRAFILVNLIVIMTFLNMIILTVLVIRGKALNSSKLTISNKAMEIYNKSKSDIIDSEILGIVKTSLKKLEYAKELDEKSLYNKINGRFRSIRFDSDASVKNDMRIQKIGNAVESGNKLSLKLSWKYDDYKQNQIYYELIFPLLSKEDIEEIRNKNSENIYNKYKDEIIAKKYIY